MNIVDLSVVLNSRTPVYPGDPPTKLKVAATMKDDGYSDSLLETGTHAGTHIDAPFHMVDGGKKLIDMPVTQFVGRGVYIRVRDKVFDLEEVKSADIRSGDIVLFHTGMSEVYYEPDYYEEYPAIPEDVAEYLVGQKVKMVGVDMCSVDHEPFNVHKILLKNNVLIIENLTNLAQLAGKEFEVTALPIRLEEDGAPARVIARYN